MDYVMKTRLGDGYRAQTWGTNLWTDGKVGTDDDAGRRELLVHNGALENFLLAGIEAYASMRIENDESLKGNLKKIAKEDFGYAMKRFNELGFAELIKKGGGHAAMASESQYHANISWAASMLYKLTGEQQYADEAVKAIRYTLQCQRTEPLVQTRPAASSIAIWQRSPLYTILISLAIMPTWKPLPPSAKRSPVMPSMSSGFVP